MLGGRGHPRGLFHPEGAFLAAEKVLCCFLLVLMMIQSLHKSPVLSTRSSIVTQARRTGALLPSLLPRDVPAFGRTSSVHRGGAATDMRGPESASELLLGHRLTRGHG